MNIYDAHSLSFIEIIKNLSIEDIGKLCQTNKEYNQLCTDPKFWTYLLERDYGISDKIDYEMFDTSMIQDPRAFYLNRKKDPRTKIAEAYKAFFNYEFFLLNNSVYIDFINCTTKLPFLINNNIVSPGFTSKLIQIPITISFAVNGPEDPVILTTDRDEFVSHFNPTEQ